ncbi:MAG TPA: hypothetical protein VLV83_25765 [Acidobacteriota bacterium]|nr:hypothetical protein [Acidobacteriota bacterium]
MQRVTLSLLAVLSVVMTVFVRPVEAQDTHTLYFPQFGNGGGLSSDLVIYNPSARRAVSGEVMFWDENGVRLQGMSATVRLSGLRSTFQGSTFVLEPQGSLTLRGDPEASQVLGSATVTADGTVSGTVRFSIPGRGIAGVGAAEPAISLIAPVRRDGQVDTGVAVRNLHSASVDVTLTLKDSEGLALPEGTAVLRDLQPEARVAMFISELFPEAQTSEFGGTLCIQASQGKLAAVALELGAAPGQFTTLPVSTLDTPPPDFGDLSGVWAGSTSQGVPLSFTVDGDQVVQFATQVNIEGQGCVILVEVAFEPPVSETITENRFEKTMGIGIFGIDSFSRTEGLFTSSITAEGTLFADQGGLGLPGIPGGCEGSTEITWTAVRQ